MEVDYQAMIFAFVGGLGLFLFGLRFMSSALQEVAGDKMRTILEQGTKSPLRGVLTGAAVTGLIQSSTATTVLTVGLVNARLLTLKQAIGVIMGANIGTTLTVYLIGFDLDEYVLPIIALGVTAYLFANNNRVKLVGKAILGIGVIFLGISIMGNGMAPLKDLPFFTNLMLNIEDNAIFGVLVGIIFTVVVNASSATIGIMQELANQGAMTYHQTIPVLFGDNIGTTITALLAAIGTGTAARRTSLTHFLFNFIGTLIFLPLYIAGVFEKIVVYFTNYLFILIPGNVGWEVLNVKLQIAQTHLVFNLSNTLIQLPFVGLLALIVTKIIPDSKDETKESYQKTTYLDKRLLANSSVALAQATRETLRMGEMMIQAFENAMGYFDRKQANLMEKGIQLEAAIDFLEREITDYIVLASEKRLSKEDSYLSYALLQSLNDIESIADLCENILHLKDDADRHHVTFSGEAKEELNQMIDLTKATLHLALQTLEKKDKTLAAEVKKNEEMLDMMQAEYRRAHIRRLNARICNGNNGAVFLDLLGTLERIGDLCCNIAEYAIGTKELG
ncbi:MAG TPA: Na/Pi cotransporter family protein [Syntrophomonadaceae bacterium]|nr:Na/Pi cotransporter family protein [Syntrophomonadaceae bacterium]HRX20381.1 Na/Pi cotransporter family protein [Syntrophomonadaceae bacterium]